MIYASKRWRQVSTSCIFHSRWQVNFAGVLADLDPPVQTASGYGPPPPPTKLSENIILGVLVEIDNTLRSSAY